MFGAGGAQVAEAYDGELNPMTFNLVKSSKAFDMSSKKLFTIGEDNEDFRRWLEETGQQSFMGPQQAPAKHSEDGWDSKPAARKNIRFNRDEISQ